MDYRPGSISPWAVPPPMGQPRFPGVPWIQPPGPPIPNEAHPGPPPMVINRGCEPQLTYRNVFPEELLFPGPRVYRFIPPPPDVQYRVHSPADFQVFRPPPLEGSHFHHQKPFHENGEINSLSLPYLLPPTSQPVQYPEHSGLYPAPLNGSYSQSGPISSSPPPPQPFNNHCDRVPVPRVQNPPRESTTKRWVILETKSANFGLRVCFFIFTPEM